jgi:hypothetical protein
VQISSAYGQRKEGSVTLPRNPYVEIRHEKPTTKQEEPDLHPDDIKGIHLYSL